MRELVVYYALSLNLSYKARIRYKIGEGEWVVLLGVAVVGAKGGGGGSSHGSSRRL